MSEKDSQSVDGRNGSTSTTGVGRRTFLQSIGAGGAAGALAGCSSMLGGDSGSDGDSGATLEWAAIYNEDETRQAMADALYEAGLSDDIELNIVGLPDANEGIQARYDQWITSGESKPDLLTVDNGWTLPFIVREQLVNLNELLDDSMVSTVKDDYFQSSVNTAQDPDTGDLYGVPLYPEPPTMQYRKDLAMEAGYDPDGENWATEPMTWQEFSQVAADIHEQSDVEYAYITQGAADENMSCCEFPEYFHSFGGAYFGGMDNLFGPVGDRPITVDEEPVIDSLRMARAMLHGSDAPETLDGYEKIMPQETLSWDVVQTQQLFESGDGAFTRQWMFGIPPAVEAFGAENVGIMPMPYAVEEGEGEYDGIGGSSPALGGWHVAMNPNSENEDAIIEFFEAMMQESFLLEQFSVEGVMPPNREIFYSDATADVEPTGRYVDAIGASLENAVPRPVTAVWQQESQRISQRARAAHQVDNDPAEEMDELVGLLEEIENS